MTSMPLEKSPVSLASGRIVELADQCVQCGLCLPVCPTYALDRNEAESPRGRIAIAAALARRQASPSTTLREHLDHCLGCLNCEKVCPANVQYGELLIETRALLGPAPQRPRQLLNLISRPASMRRLRRVGGWLAFARWKNWLTDVLPTRSAWRTALLTMPSSAPAAPVRASREARGKSPLALFPGCVASVDDAQAQQAAITLLEAAGFQVSVLPAFCCGAMDLHGGAADSAEQAAQRVRQAWTASGATQLISVTPGCLGTLRRALPGVSVIDPLELLATHADRLRFRPLAQRIALHLPCTQINVARSDGALWQLLRRVPELEVMLLPRPPYCCGAAGSHLLEFPERAAQLRDDTLRQAAPLEPQRLLSSNIGCRLHLAVGIDAQGLNWLHQHPLTLLAQQLEPH
ncbi:(Fe-S)-binding protein [Rhodanobacter sp. MP7CTX1]|jgi:glycolate oxidase iron-sulfur subunit|uniref:(Fe-S)-binding protein n=1 Tax=Rhodanobacter sp. MP7CTX1 TaxID=2723084 RepID=UPI00160AD830|nr:(Fe-S)-binding protein [Rhodanobacter sp. MP7CTX1]MBB6188197.1 glycolate oxidase iron-sulfur subunit [Rhodanobacter sp. MP7CTX1]